MRTLQQIALRATIGLAFLGFVGRLLVPVGFMPTALDEGWPVKLCLGGYATGHSHHRALPGDTSGDHSGHLVPDRGQGDSGEDGQPVPCRLGRVFSSAALVNSVDLVVTFELMAGLTMSPPKHFSGTTTDCPQPRGPPSPLPLDISLAG